MVCVIVVSGIFYSLKGDVRSRLKTHAQRVYRNSQRAKGPHPSQPGAAPQEISVNDHEGWKPGLCWQCRVVAPGFQPSLISYPSSWGVAPGWDGLRLSALNTWTFGTSYQRLGKAAESGALGARRVRCADAGGWEARIHSKSQLRPLTSRGTPGHHSKTAHRCDPRKRGRSGALRRVRRQVYLYQRALSPSSTSSYRNFQAAAAPDIAPQLEAQCPWPLPYQ